MERILQGGFLSEDLLRLFLAFQIYETIHVSIQHLLDPLSGDIHSFFQQTFAEPHLPCAVCTLY